MQLRIARGITLIEVLTVLAIAALLMAIAYPALSQARAKAREIGCISRLHQIHAALELYGSDYPGFEPIHENAPYPNDAMRDPSTLVPYLGGADLLYCPETPPCAKSKFFSSYIWTAMPKRSSPLFNTARRQMDEWFKPGSTYPIVHCLVHDEVRYYPGEKYLSQALNPPFVIRLLVGGNIVKGRYDIPRGHDIARACR